MPVEISVCPDLIPPFQPVRAIDFGLTDDYVLEVTANSQYAIASASDKLIRLYDLSTLGLATTLKMHQDRISRIKVINDQYLFSAGEDGKLVRWDLRTALPAQTFQYKRPLTAFDVNCNDSMAVVGADTSSAGATGAAPPELVFFDTRQTSILSIFEESHGDIVTELQCHPTNPSQLLSSSTDGLVNHYDVHDFDEVEDLLSVINPGASLSKAGYFGPGAEYVYSLTHVETFSLHTLEGDLICDYGDLRNIQGINVNYAIDCSYDAASQRFYLITGNNEGDVHIFHVNIGQLQLCQTLKAPGGHSDIVRSFYWNHATHSALTGGEDGRMCAWQASL